MILLVYDRIESEGKRPWSRWEAAVKRHADRLFGPEVVYTASQDGCPDCGRKLSVYQRDSRRVQALDCVFVMTRRDKRCGADCPGKRPIWYAIRDLRLVLPRRIYGLEVTLYVGERHLLDRVSLCQITRDLNARGVQIDQRHTGRVFRDFVTLTQLARGDDAALRARLAAQGGIVLMCDGVQFEERSPVLYVAWDAISGEPLFGERKAYRGEDDLVPLLERVRNMGVPIIAAVTDKETGLVPAVEHVFPGVPYQYCQTHYLKNCAKPMAEDLTALQASVQRRAEGVRAVAKFVANSEQKPATVKETKKNTGGRRRRPSRDSATPTSRLDAEVSASDIVREVELVQELSEIVRLNSRVSGKAPLDPPELKRHERLEAVRELVDQARQEKKLHRRGGRARDPLALA